MGKQKEHQKCCLPCENVDNLPNIPISLNINIYMYTGPENSAQPYMSEFCELDK